MVFIELRWETFAGHGIYEHNPHHNSCIQFTVGCSCRLSKKSCPFLYSESLYKNRKDFLRHTVMYLYIVSLETLFFLTLHSIYILLLLRMTLTLTCLCFDLPNEKSLFTFNSPFWKIVIIVLDFSSENWNIWHFSTPVRKKGISPLLQLL